MQNEDHFPQYWVPSDLAGSWLSETEIREPPSVTCVRPRNARVARLLAAAANDSWSPVPMKLSSALASAR